jgi:hypothetical protein
MGRFEKSFAYFLPKHVALSVIDVIEQNDRPDDSNGSGSSYKPCSDDWAVANILRKQLRNRVRTLWCGRTGKDIIEFPYSKEFCAQLYLYFRKHPEYCVPCRQELEAAEPSFF